MSLDGHMGRISIAAVVGIYTTGERRPDVFADGIFG
jgi:hypothetical protein